MKSHPFGLIDATWGGTPAESWTSEQSLMKMEEFRKMIEENKNAPQDDHAISEEEKVNRREEVIQQADASIFPKVKNPQAVRYGWSNNPNVNLYNQEGLPASPFRTDLWEDTQSVVSKR